ncbi:cupin domain-containing protein [Pseudoduganella lutea]|uniref:Cupin domain-containing protein n=1 Tax=Pseudoduganella lutea TaxID=321985 RepID=A0A4P6KTD9_9BURK|nr:cupin domain-containing protein [Pseudoduganella lutea]QBE62170.1 cupin domain-containing protein [Pseudoduganella lutea]
MKHPVAALLFAALPFHASLAQEHGVHATPAATGGVKVTQVYDHKIPGMPNKSLKGVLVEYAPGAANPAHTHAKSALIYATVLEGAVLNQLNGGPVRTFTKGQNFTEQPGDRHDVSANASKTEPAKLLAVFVVDSDDKALTTPIAAGR